MNESKRRKPLTTLALAIEKQARKLSATEREQLAELLLAHTQCKPVSEGAWVAEAERRFSRWKRKATRQISAAKALDDIRKELSRRSNQQ